MATKRTKADKAQRQADELESKSERRPGTSTEEDNDARRLQPSRCQDRQRGLERTLVRSRLDPFCSSGEEVFVFKLHHYQQFSVSANVYVNHSAVSL
jgi:hypothetical protein